MIHSPHILASGEELIVPVIIFIIWGLSAMAGLAKKANQTNAARKPTVMVRRPPQDVRLSGFTIPARALQPPQLAPSIQRRMPAAAMRGVMPAVRPRAAVVPPQPIAAPLPPPVAALPPPVTATPPAVSAVLLEPLEEDLADRIIWTEILGKPLALRDGF